MGPRLSTLTIWQPVTFITMAVISPGSLWSFPQSPTLAREAGGPWRWPFQHSWALWCARPCTSLWHMSSHLCCIVSLWCDCSVTPLILQMGKPRHRKVECIRDGARPGHSVGSGFYAVHNDLTAPSPGHIYLL